MTSFFSTSRSAARHARAAAAYAAESTALKFDFGSGNAAPSVSPDTSYAIIHGCGLSPAQELGVVPGVLLDPRTRRGFRMRHSTVVDVPPEVVSRLRGGK